MRDYERAKQRRSEKKHTKTIRIRLRVNICFALHIFHRRFVFRQAENRIFVPIVERPAQRILFCCSLVGLVSFEPSESCVSRTAVMRRCRRRTSHCCLARANALHARAQKSSRVASLAGRKSGETEREKGSTIQRNPRPSSS